MTFVTGSGSALGFAMRSSSVIQEPSPAISTNGVIGVTMLLRDDFRRVEVIAIEDLERTIMPRAI
jgi:hypothetical protein